MTSPYVIEVQSLLIGNSFFPAAYCWMFEIIAAPSPSGRPRAGRGGGGRHRHRTQPTWTEA